ncbi:MAG: glycosyltransferase family 4 protein [Blastocatellia bacterium]
MNSSPKILLMAYQCGPGMGSVSQIGWEWYSRLAARHPVTLVTHIRNREVIAGAGAAWNGPEVVYIDTEWFAGPLYRLASRIFPKSQHSIFLVSSLDFFVFDYAAARRLKRMAREGARWDVAHMVTPVSTATPTRLHQLGCPVLLGPLNGGLDYPRGFDEIMRTESTWLHPIRYFGRVIDWLVGSSRHVTIFLAATQATIRSISPRHRQRAVSMLENGVDLNRFTPASWPEPPSAGNPLKLLFVGRLIPFKALPLLLEAMERVRNEIPMKLTIVGAGPMEREWKERTDSMGLSGEVDFVGERTLDQISEHMRSAHVFCLPSVRESGGAVLIEAMASARPVIAVAFGGPAEIVDDGVGRGIAPDGPESVIQGLAQALRDVYRNPEAWRARGAEGRRRAEEKYAWDAKIKAALQLYRQVMK